ncbi:MAG: bifunctional methylenetetrahydrofolate dehydrogenase/methenyltetrahydrofolate cyclohydrolase FolD [Clostridia bacterium]|nr:bifunctional methylenetetrahydrofolate dehydrogenase/methenyltetrahydrofolate cyclohydrolase FolD [Clostridia bacterium]
MTIIDGKAVSASVREELKGEAENFAARYGRKVALAVIIVGDDPASHTYVNNKIKGCEQVGFRSICHRFDDGVPQEQVADVLKQLANDDTVDGILVQLPLPKGYDSEYLLSLIPDSKDVDGFSPANTGLLSMNRPNTVSCTPLGIMSLLASTGRELKGKHAVVIGRSNTVGKPMAMLLLNADCTVTVCHSRTRDIAEIARQADILVAAVGRAGFVTADMVKDGAIVIDVGINRIDGKLYGDVDFASVAPKCSYITPVPGGVGPMTISMLLKNTLQAAVNRLK